MVAAALTDLEAAIAGVKEFDGPAAVVIKHNTPCGVSLGATVGEAVPRDVPRDAVRTRPRPSGTSARRRSRSI